MVEVMPYNLCINELLIRSLLDRGVVSDCRDMEHHDLCETLGCLIFFYKRLHIELNTISAIIEYFLLKEASDLIQGIINAYPITKDLVSNLRIHLMPHYTPH